MRLQFAVVSSIGGSLLADWTGIAIEVEFSTGEHGYADFQVLIPLSQVPAFHWFDRPGPPWVEVWGDGDLVWQGRVEDVRLVVEGIRLVALGAWSVFGDVPYRDTPGTTTGDAIVKDILTAARVDNPTMLSASVWRIQAPGVNVYDEVYEDADMREVLTRLATLGDDQDPPARWEVGVWEDGVLHFRPRGSDARTWYTDVPRLEVERSLSQVWNSVYTVYDSGASTTATVTDAQSVTRYGVTRRRAVSSDTSDIGQAQRERDAALADGATPIPRASVGVDRVYTATGTPAPKYLVRSGDTLVLRNLPPESGPTIDRIRSFRIAETRYRPDGDILEIVPEAPLPALDVLVARSLEVAT